MVWNTVTNQEVFVKSPGSVVVVRCKAINYINYLHLVARCWCEAVVLGDADND